MIYTNTVKTLCAVLHKKSVTLKKVTHKQKKQIGVVPLYYSCFPYIPLPILDWNRLVYLPHNGR